MGYVWVILAIWLIVFATIGGTITSIAEHEQVKINCYDGHYNLISGQTCYKEQIKDKALRNLSDISLLLMLSGIIIVPITCILIQNYLDRRNNDKNTIKSNRGKRQSVA